MEVIIKILDIELIKKTDEDDKTSTLINFEDYLKLRYFFVEKRASKYEYT